MYIIDNTIRDGSYAVDFKFSLKDVKIIASKLSKLGLEYIEVGHGMGLNASSDKYGIALESDVDYIKTAIKAAPDSKIGIFCIPGIAKLKDVESAIKNGISFIRIGTTVDQLENVKPFIKYAHSKCIEVFVNFMKTYTYLPDDFGKGAAKVEHYGADGVYIVDSAGMMMPEDIQLYIDSTRKYSDISLGFHGHNNLGLAVANSVYCVENGVKYIDCSFQGLGRSLGNASLEQVVMVLERKGLIKHFDIPAMLEYGHDCLKKIVDDKAINPLDYICGYSGFHSSFLKDIYRCCNQHEVDPLRLIMAYSEINKTTMDYDILEKVALTLPRDLEENPYSFRKYFSSMYED